MPSRLSSLLVRDGLVGVKRMEKAFQRQVIYGGSLDTILLEMNLVPEERLTQYLALASGLPPAARDEGTRPDPAALAVLPREVAERSRAVPLAVDGETLRILVCSPLEIAELEDLADQLDRPLQPLITPEYRWHLAFATAYELDPPARFTTLARTLDVDAIVAPVGRARTIIVEASPVEASPIEVIGEVTERTPALAEATKRLPFAAAPDEGPSTIPFPPAPRPPAILAPPLIEPPDVQVEMLHDTSPRDRRSTLIGVEPSRVNGDSLPPPVRAAAPSSSAPPAPAATPEPIVEHAPITYINPAAPTPITGKRPTGPMQLPSRRPATAPIATAGRDGPITVVTARELFASAEDRDTVFLTLLRVARSRARWAGLLTVQGGAAIGRVALAEPGLETGAIHTVLIPLDAPSPFRTVVSNHQPHIGPLVSGDPGIDSMVLRMGGTMPPSALLLPIVLRERVVALVVAHRVHSALRLEDITELLPMAHAASEAIGRLIVRHKSAGHRVPSEAPVAIEPGLDDTRKISRPAARVAAAEPVAPPSFEEGLEVSMIAEAPRPIETVLDEIEQAREGHAEDALAEAVERPSEALGELHRRFPGPLRIDRFAVAGRPLRAAQYGGLLELVVRLGPVSAELLIEKMSSPQRDLRFYATVCTAEVRPRTAVQALAERLFDQDFGVRAAAIEALTGYPVHDLGTALVRARRAVHSSDPEVVGAAAAAIVELGDTDAVTDLIGVIERNDRAGEHARRALVALTAQDFGTSERKWRKWYDTSRKRHRIEWLIDGLAHKEDAVRETAINDLRRLTGEYFGYHYDLPRREREAAAARWVAWWREAGQRRFIVADERDRPTGLLPARHDGT